MTKRAGDQRNAEGSSTPTPGPKSKTTRTDRGPVEYSSHIRTKISNQSRTGQACDRCKYRKIKCDTAIGACAHCREVKHECLVTDRVSGITARRGYYQELERTKEKLEAHTQQLEAILRANGIDIHPWQVDEAGDPVPPPVPVDAQGNPINDPEQSQDHWTRFNDTVWVKNYQQRQRVETQAPGHSLSNLNLANYDTLAASGLFGPAPAAILDGQLCYTSERLTHVGLAVVDNEPLSSVRGTRLNVMGTTIDICSLDTVDIENHKSNEGRELPNVSLKAFMLSLTNSIPQPKISLPSRAEGMSYAEWYFLTINPHYPALHKPTFMAMLTRMYDDPAYKATPTEKSIAHLVFSMIFYQYGVRVDEDPVKQRRWNELSHQHFHWCLHNYLEPGLDTSLQGLQVFYLQALHARNFPKPGCSFILTTFAFNRAIELKLNKNPKMVDGKHTLHTEMHKRLWWCIVSLLVTLDGRLGNPMPIGLQDIGCDFPLLIPDDELTDEGIRDESKIGQSEYSIGFAAHRLLPLQMEMWSTLYSVRRNPTKYIAVVRSLEERLETWEKALPPELQPRSIALTKSSTNPSDTTFNRTFSLYAQMLSAEFRLSLRHPSVAMTTDAVFLGENTRICEEEADKLLRCAYLCKGFKTLDTTWYQLAVYCCAMFTTLSCHWHRRVNATSEEVEKLRVDMDTWMEILTEMARLVGASPHDSLMLRLRRVVFDTIASIESEMGADPTLEALPPPQVTSGPDPQRAYADASNPAVLPIQGSSSVEAPYYPPPPQPFSYSQPMYQDPATTVSYLPPSAPPYIFTGTPDGADPAITYASHHVPGHHSAPAPPPAPGVGFLTASAWQEWQALIADSQAQERFTATIMMDMQAQQQHQQQHQYHQRQQSQSHDRQQSRGRRGQRARDPGVVGEGGQWPLTLFNMGSHMPGGSSGQ